MTKKLVVLMIFMLISSVLMVTLPNMWVNASPTVINVPDDYLTIQAALNAATSGDTINVSAGTYTEYLNITTDNLTIEGAGIDQSIIDLDGLMPYWHYGTCSSSFASLAGVYICGYGSSDEIVENVTFRGFTVKNGGLNPPINATGTHTGSDNATILTDSSASWTPGAFAGYWVHNLGDRDIDYKPARSYGQIINNTATTVNATLSSGVDNDWDNGDKYVITAYRHFYDAYGDGQEDVRGMSIANGKNILIQYCKITDCGYGGITTGYARCVSTHKYSENITIDSCISSGHPVTGISVGSSIGPITITNNTCSNNKRPALGDSTREYNGYGIHVSGKSTTLMLSGVIANNTCSNNGFEGIIVDKYTDGVIVENNVVTGHNFDQDGAGIFMYHWGHPERCKNHVVRNNIVTNNIRGIIAYYAQDCIIENNIVTTDSGTFPLGQGGIKIDNAHNITVKDNTISCDGTGITIQSYDSSYNAYDNTITGNIITGAKFAGILIYGDYARNNTFTHNYIRGTTTLTLWKDSVWEETQADGVFIDDDAGTGNIFHNNCIWGNIDDGMENQVDTTTVDAKYNWWGDASGPSGAGSGSGDSVSENVDFDSWLNYPNKTLLYTDPQPVQKNLSDVSTYFNVSVIIENVTDLFGFDVNITWDNTLITLNKCHYTDTLDAIWGMGNWYVAKNATGAGWYNLAAVSTSSSFTKTANQAIFVLEFHVEMSSNFLLETPIHFDLVKLSDDTEPVPNPIDAIAIDGCYMTATTPDLEFKVKKWNGTEYEYISPPYDFEYCDWFEVEVYVTDICENSSLTDYNLTITFDHTLVKFTGVDYWGIFGTGTSNYTLGTDVIQVSDEFDPWYGEEGLLFALTFHVEFACDKDHIWRSCNDNSPTFDIDITDAELSFTEGRIKTMSEIIMSDPLTIQINFIRGDVNCDGQVTIADISAMAFYYGQTTPEMYDLNCDGIIDIYDLVTAATNYGYGT